MNIKELLELKLSERLPKDAVVDWECTNHYELSGMVDGEYEWSWICLHDFLADQDTCETETGKRYGAVLDAAANAPKMEAKLREIVDMLPEILEAAYHFNGELHDKLKKWEQ